MTARDEVIQEGLAQARERGFYQDGDDTLVALESNRCTNMTGGRPSDGARSTVGAYLRDPDGFRVKFHETREREARERRRY